MVARINPPLVVIVGSTASGKSELAIKAAKKFNGEIICADSRTIYKGMDIGTAKPSLQDQEEVRHHLLDIVYPDQPFTAADFKRLALQAIEDISQRGKMPVMVGGSGLYIDSVLFDYQFGKPPDLGLRQQLTRKSIEELQEICRQNNIDLPENYLNKRYLIRAIEMGGLIQQKRKLRPNTLVVGITTNKETLKARIESRARQMVDDGVIDEVAKLGKKYDWDNEAMKGNMYRIFRTVADGTMAIDQGIEQVVQSDLRLAKKQLTWFKRNNHIVWGKPDQLIAEIEQFVEAANNRVTT